VLYEPAPARLSDKFTGGKSNRAGKETEHPMFGKKKQTTGHRGSGYRGGLGKGETDGQGKTRWGPLQSSEGREYAGNAVS